MGGRETSRRYESSRLQAEGWLSISGLGTFFLLALAVLTFQACGGNASIIETDFLKVVVVGGDIQEDNGYAGANGIHAESEGGVKITHLKVTIYVDRNRNGKCDEGEKMKEDEYNDPSGTYTVDFGGMEFTYNRKTDGPIRYDAEGGTNSGATFVSKGDLYK